VRSTYGRHQSSAVAPFVASINWRNRANWSMSNPVRPTPCSAGRLIGSTPMAVPAGYFSSTLDFTNDVPNGIAYDPFSDLRHGTA
jgi:hypothetical protein